MSDLSIADRVLLTAVGYATYAVWLASRGRAGTKDSLGGPKWSLTDSWASTFTTVGAILGSVLAASGTLSRETILLPKAGYLGLNLFFASLVIIAAFFYNATRSKGKENRNTVYRGSIRAFLVSSVLTLWGASGQLLTLVLLLEELHTQAALSVLAVSVFQGLLLMTFGMLLPYAFNSIQLILAKHALVSQLRQNALNTKGVPPDPPDWSLL